MGQSNEEFNVNQLIKRVIKFKFWDTQKKRWLEVGEQVEKEYKQKYIIPCQYTGVKDENGKEIYEGDIVLPAKFREKEPNVVHYIGSGFYRVKKINGRVYINPMGSCQLKLIGNIFENINK